MRKRIKNIKRNIKKTEDEQKRANFSDNYGM